MIRADQPQCFDTGIAAAVSSRIDGQMQHGWAESDKHVAHNIETFLHRSGFRGSQRAKIRVVYGAHERYDVIRRAEDIGTGTADCIITDGVGTALYLPVADCIGCIFYEPSKRVLALAHLGRHSTIAHLASKTVAYFKEQYHCQPKDIRVWMSPSIKKADYILPQAPFAEKDTTWKEYCNKVANGYSVDLQGYNTSQLLSAGVRRENITISPINTATNPEYWSHFMTAQQSGAVPPRFLVACWLK